jgi:hypothetical protein
MALVKALPLPSGVTPNYLRIERVVYDRAEGFVQVHLSAYLDAAHATNGAAPVAAVAPIVLQGEEAEVMLAALHDLAGPLAYDLVRTFPQFADAANA